jgi:hypothetical protein
MIGLPTSCCICNINLSRIMCAVEHAQLSAGIAEHFYSPLPRRLPQVIRGQNPARQSRCVAYP